MTDFEVRNIVYIYNIYIINPVLCYLTDDCCCELGQSSPQVYLNRAVIFILMIEGNDKIRLFVIQMLTHTHADMMFKCIFNDIYSLPPAPSPHTSAGSPA